MDPSLLLSDLISKNGDRPFLVEDGTGRTLRYGQIPAAVSDLGKRLEALGVGPGDRIATLLPNSLEFAVVYLTCLARGVAVVPLNPGHPVADVEYMLRVARPRVVLLGGEWEPKLPPTGAVRLAVGGEGGWRAEEDYPADSPLETAGGDGQRLLSLTFTSGTTNVPKGVAHSASGLLTSARAFNRRMGFQAGEVFLHVMPMFYMAGFLNTLLCPLMCGGTVVLSSPFSPQVALGLWKRMMAHGVTALWASPTMLATLLRVDRTDGTREYARRKLHRICVGTAPLAPTLRRDFQERYGVVLSESYGLTELLFVCAAVGDEGPGVGRPLDGVELRLSAKDAEVEVRTTAAMLGYLDPDTGEVVPPREEWFPTGDLGRLNSEGGLEITGRKKDLIIHGGVNVSPRAVEETLLGCSGVRDVAVLGMPHPIFGEEVVAVLSTEGSLSRSELERFCRERLPAGSRPARFYRVDAMPTTVTGKIQKNILREQLTANAIGEWTEGASRGRAA